MSELLSMSW